MVQFPWSLNPEAGLGIARREGGLGRKEKGTSQASSVGPGLDVGADAHVEPSWEPLGPQEPSAQFPSPCHPGAPHSRVDKFRGL